MIQVKVNNILYVMDTEAYQITEDTDVDIIYVPEDHYDEYVTAQWGQVGELLTGDEVARIQGVISKMQKYNYNCIVVNVPEYVIEMERLGSMVRTKVNVSSTSSATWIAGNISNVTEMYIDGVKLDEPVLKYTFETDGVHNVDYILTTKETIVDNQFANRWSIIDIQLPDGVINIGANAFNSIDSVTNLIIPSTVSTIGAGAFWGMSNLQTINIPEGVTIINENLFNNCQKLNNVIIPNTVTEIARNSFVLCKGITTLEIPNSVTTIGYNAFGQCSNMTDVTIGSGITFIDEQVFMNCSKLARITILATIPPTLGNYSTFSGNASGRKIYVPAESVEAYKAASGWSTYAADIEAIPTE